MPNRTSRPFARLPRLASLVAVGLALAACGFRPMDAHRTDEPDIPELARIDVSPISDRVGQLMRAGITRRLNPTSTVADPAYTLRVTYTGTSVARGTRSDDSAIRNDYILTANFTLEAKPQGDSPGRRLLAGTSVTTTRHNNPEYLYAGFVSERAAQERAADLAAEDVARQIRLYFLYPQNYPPITTPEVKPVERTRPTRP